MRVSFSKFKPVAWHILAWLGFVSYEQVLLPLAGALRYNEWAVALTYSLNLLLFYANTEVLLPRLYGKHRRWQWGYLVGLSSLLLAYVGLRYGLYFYLAPALELLNPGAALVGLPFLLVVFYRGAWFVLAGTGYWFARHLLRVERAKLAQEHQLRLAERSLLESQLTFLKSQINPHLLFNSLNALYAHVYPYSQEAAQGVLLLADAMRYAMQEPRHGKVALGQEVAHLRNYIALHQLRFHQQLCVEFTVRGHVQLRLVAPLLLLTLLENGFQHGELTEAAHPLTVHLEVVDNQLTFRTRNKKRRGPKTPGLGIGLANTTQRLALLYPGCHELVVHEEPDFYTCCLTLSL